MQTVMKEEKYIRRMTVTLAVVANGGSVAVQVKVGDTWVTADTFWADGVHSMNMPQAWVRIVPTAGAGFEVYA